MPRLFSCPTKLIFAGEHFVVHGESAIAMPVLPRNRLRIEKSDSLLFRTPWAVWKGKKCERGSFFFSPVVKWLVDNGHDTGYSLDYDVRGFKGMGNSASASVLTAAALLFENGINDMQLVKKLALECEGIAHGGRASGVDVHAVLSDKPLLFRKMDQPRAIEFRIPHGCSLIVSSTFTGKTAKTADQIRKFSSLYSGCMEQKKLEYSTILDIVLSKVDDPLELGKAMNSLHSLLEPVSTQKIEHARKIALDSGCLGSKISGAGGEGSIIISLCWSNDCDFVISNLSRNGYKSFVSSIASGGVLQE